MYLDPGFYIEVDTSALTLEQAYTNIEVAATSRGWGGGETNTEGDPKYPIWFTHDKTTHIYDPVLKAWERWVRWSRIEGAVEGVKQLFALYVGETPTAVMEWDTETEKMEVTVRDNVVNALSVGGATLLDLQGQMDARDAANRAYAESLQRRQNFKPFDVLAFFDPRGALPTESGAYISRFTSGIYLEVGSGYIYEFQDYAIKSGRQAIDQAELNSITNEFDPANDPTPANGIYKATTGGVILSSVLFEQDLVATFNASGQVKSLRNAASQAELDGLVGWVPSAEAVPTSATVRVAETGAPFPYEKDIIHFLEFDTDGNLLSVAKDPEGTNLQDVVTLVGGIADKDVLIQYQVQHSDNEWGQEGKAAWSPVNANQLTASEYYHVQQLAQTGGVAALQAVDTAQQTAIDANAGEITDIKTVNTTQQDAINANASEITDIKAVNTTQQDAIDANVANIANNAALAIQMQAAIEAIEQDLIDNYLTSDAVTARIRELVGNYKIIGIHTSPVDMNGPGLNFLPGIDQVFAIQYYPEAATGTPRRGGSWGTTDGGNNWVMLS